MRFVGRIGFSCFGFFVILGFFGLERFLEEFFVLFISFVRKEKTISIREEKLGKK